MLFRSRTFSIKAKLNLILGVVAASAVLLACLAFGYKDITGLRESTVKELNAVGDVVAANTVASIAFDNADDATEVLSSLELEPSIRLACVYRTDGKPFAIFRAEGFADEVPLHPVGEDGYEFAEDGTLIIYIPIYDEEDRVGTLYLKAGMEHLRAMLIEHLWMAVLVGVASLTAAMLLASRLVFLVSLPIKRLAETSDKISKDRNYSVRVEKMYDDEIGSLYDAFNRMLAKIETSQKELQSAHDELETRVEERTLALSKTNENLTREISVRMFAEEELKILQAKQINSARKMGMAEIATSVLHNVGNVLNSVNVSATVIKNTLKNYGAADLTRAADLVREHREDLTSFITEDERGKYLPKFLSEMGKQLVLQEETLLNEVEALASNIAHINDIVTVQQSNAGVSGLVESVSMAEIIEDAISINIASMGRHNISIVRNFEHLSTVMIEKQRVMQILVNLIANAKYAVIESGLSEGNITVSLIQSDGEVQVDVIDNGVGITQDNMTRIFSHGFTTRKEGHGFGLHSAAIAAKEMGGSLTAHSEGPGTGAKFSLNVPVKESEVKECQLEKA